MSQVKNVLQLWNEPLLRRYLGEVRRKCGVVETLALPSMRDLPAIQIETLFVPPLLSKTAVSADVPPANWPHGENLLTELQEYRQIVVLGDPGGGKTTLSNWLAWRLTSGANAPLPSYLENRIPIPCILRDMPIGCFDDGSGIIDLAIEVFSNLLGSQSAESLKETITRWVDAGQYVLILDGIDEILLSRRATVAKWIKEASKQNACVLATSRIVGYEDYPVDSFVTPVGSDSEIEEINPRRDSISKALPSAKKMKALNIKMDLASSENQSVSNYKWAHLRYLMPFDQQRISDFARNWYRQRCVTDTEAKQKTSDLLTALSQSEVTLNLARTPNLLSLMAIVHRERAHLPDGKALLYDEIVNAYLNTIDKQRKIGPDDIFAHYGWKERKTWLAYVGYKMQENRGWSTDSAGILATEDDVLSWLKEVMIATGVNDFNIIANEFLNWVARRSGLLLPRGENRYAFVHLSFQEYFCACYLENSIVRPAFIMDKLPLNAPVTKARVTYWARAHSWTETYIFLFELLSAEHDQEWVESLLNIINEIEHGTTAHLAARLIKNKHVKLSTENLNSLAEACCPWIYKQWGLKTAFDSDIVKTLIESGHCVIFTNPDDPELGSYVHTENFFRTSMDGLEKIRMIIMRNGFQPSQQQLQKMLNLSCLIVENGGDLDCSNLEKIKNIRMLRASHVRISNAHSLGRCTRLRHIQIYHAEEINLEFLSNLKALKNLELANLRVSNLNSISSCKKLILLMLRDLDVSDLSFLSGIRKLETLLLGDLPVHDISFVSVMKFLDYLQLSDMPVRDISPVSKCTNLQNLDLDNVEVMDLSPLSKLKHLDGVYLQNIYTISIDALSEIKNLSYLMLTQLPLSSVEPLKLCTKLRHLTLREIEIDNLDFLEYMPEIRVLNLTNLPVSDISSLKYLKNLVYLEISKLDVSDLSVLKELPSLSSVVTTEESNFDIAELSSIDRVKVTVHPIGYNPANLI